MIRGRRALLIALAGLMSGCVGPLQTRTGAAPTAGGLTPGATPSAAATPAPNASPTPRPISAAQITATPAPSATPAPTATPAADVQLQVRLVNGTAQVQLDGRTIQPGRVTVAPGKHQLAALVDGDVVALADTPAQGGQVDLVIPPPFAGLAVMVENQADARPQSGLPLADVVYEALAEGGISRFLAVFLSGDAGLLGPVRSLRHYYAFLAGDYGADLVHIGASPEGFAWRDAMNLGSLDESAGDPGVWRVRSRRPPHNAYTDTAADRGFLIDVGRQRNHSWGPLRFVADAPAGTEVAENVSIGFSPWPYRVDYTWDASQTRYLRVMDGAEHRDAETGEQIAPSSVVVQFADVQPIPNDPKLRLDVDLVGAGGDLLIFSGGTQRSGSWSKDGPRSPTKWLDAHGQPFVLPPGQVWVEIVPLNSPITLS